jgi:hypothetical protein
LHIWLSFSPVQHNQLSTKTVSLLNRFICRRQPIDTARGAGQFSLIPEKRKKGRWGSLMRFHATVAS